MVRGSNPNWSLFHLPRIVRVGCVAMLMVAGGCVLRPLESDRTIDGLVRMPSDRVDEVYVAPGASLAGYRRVMLDPVDFAFKSGWQRGHPGLAARDIEHIRGEGAALFREVFARELQKGGYDLVEQSADDVLRVTASIVDLDITAPGGGTPEVTRTYVVSLGEMTLLAELRDSVSGAILARVADRERGREFGNLQIASNVNASVEARRAFEMWATLLRNALDGARTSTPESN